MQVTVSGGVPFTVTSASNVTRQLATGSQTRNDLVTGLCNRRTGTWHQLGIAHATGMQCNPRCEDRALSQRNNTHYACMMQHTASCRSQPDYGRSRIHLPPSTQNTSLDSLHSRMLARPYAKGGTARPLSTASHILRGSLFGAVKGQFWTSVFHGDAPPATRPYSSRTAHAEDSLALIRSMASVAASLSAFEGSWATAVLLGY